MRKQLGLITSLLFLCATALFWVGCSGYNNNSCETECVKPCSPEPCRPVCAPRCAPACAPVCAPKPVCCPEPVCAPKPACCPEPVCSPKPACEPVCVPKPACCPQPVCKPVCKPVCPEPQPCCVKPIVCKYPPANECSCDGLVVNVKQPKLCILGDTYVMDVEIRATKDVCDVVVNASLPDGVTYVRSQPADGISSQNGRLTWRFPSMSAGQVKCARVYLKADREGDLCMCFCATAVPVKFCALLCAKPQLSCEKCGPDEVCPGDEVPFTITVTNHGSCAAEEVVVTDNVPDGLEHASGQRTLTFKLGTIQPCETKKVCVTFCASKRGKVCNTVQVTACNANPISCQACVCICCCAVDLTKNGPKEVSIGKNADYVIVATNTGDKVLTDVVITDNAPIQTSIVEARGASIQGNQAVWRLRELKPGERQQFNISLTTCNPGYFCNRVNLDNCQGCTASAEACTRWKGRPALNVCVDQPEGSVCVGEPVNFTVRVVNQGSEEDHDLSVVLNFPSQVAPVSGSGPTAAQVSGQSVTFAPVPVIGPGQSLLFRVTAQARASTGSGDARIKTKVSSESVKTPIEQEESIIVN